MCDLFDFETMWNEIFCLLTVVCTSLIYADSLQKYPYISDCIFYDLGSVEGTDYATFVCAASGSFVDPSTQVKCGNYGGYWPGTIDFKGCKFTEIERDFFGPFPNMHTFIISNVDLEKITTDTFKKATNITNLIVAHNRLKEIPQLAFFNARKLKNLNFSRNIIKQIDSLAFVGLNNLTSLDLSHNKLTKFDDKSFKDLSNLKFLNLSHNQINKLEANTLDFHSSLYNQSNVLTLPNLLELDLANNNLTALNGHVFDELVKLKQLNLSFNPIAQLKLETFMFLINLEHLNLRRINISSIAMGTFSHQQKLISLDLSENLLKTMDFKLFLPILPDLTSLRLASNQLVELKGFRNSLLPQLLSLDIQNNDFNCSYLEEFMESVNWEKLRMPIDPYLVDISKPNIRGINCKETSRDSNETQAQAHEHSNERSEQKNHNNIFVVVLLFVICVIMLVFFILFIVLNREKIFNRFGRLSVTYSTNEITPENVEYSNTECLIK